MKAIGIDIGGTKITTALINYDGQIIKQHICPTPSNHPKMEVVEVVYEAIAKVYDQSIEGIGIGVPGLVDLDHNLVFC